MGGKPAPISWRFPLSTFLGLDLGNGWGLNGSMVRRLRPALASLKILGSGLAIAACVGSIGDGSDPAGGMGTGLGGKGGPGGTSPGNTTTDAICTKLSPGAAPLR